MCLFNNHVRISILHCACSGKLLLCGVMNDSFGVWWTLFPFRLRTFLITLKEQISLPMLSDYDSQILFICRRWALHFFCVLSVVSYIFMNTLHTMLKCPTLSLHQQESHCWCKNTVVIPQKETGANDVFVQQAAQSPIFKSAKISCMNMLLVQFNCIYIDKSRNKTLYY